MCVSENVGDPIANGNFEGTYAYIYIMVSNWGCLFLKQSNMFIYFLPISNNVTFSLGKSTKPPSANALDWVRVQYCIFETL